MIAKTHFVPLFLGSHTALDFLNTAYAPSGNPVEVLGGGKDYVRWLAAAGLIAASDIQGLSKKFGAKALDAAAEEARRVREWLREWLTRWRTRPNDDYSDELRELNKLLARNVFDQAVVRQKGSYALATVVRPDDAQALLGLVAQQVAGLLTSADPGLVKSCASEECTLWFLDTTKSHRRMYCSPAACGNRAKVAAFRQRQRE